MVSIPVYDVGMGLREIREIGNGCIDRAARIGGPLASTRFDRSESPQRPASLPVFASPDVPSHAFDDILTTGGAGSWVGRPR
jgi:hypothetical protein